MSIYLDIVCKILEIWRIYYSSNNTYTHCRLHLYQGHWSINEILQIPERNSNEDFSVNISMVLTVQ